MQQITTAIQYNIWHYSVIGKEKKKKKKKEKKRRGGGGEGGKE